MTLFEKRVVMKYADNWYELAMPQYQKNVTKLYQTTIFLLCKQKQQSYLKQLSENKCFSVSNA